MKIAVDLTKLLPGGGNGGIKKTIFSFLDGVRKVSQEKIVYAFLCNAATKEEVAERAQAHDFIWCVQDDVGGSIGEGSWLKVDDRFLRENEVDLLYLPFGEDRFGGGRYPAVRLLGDFLHAVYPEGLPIEVVEYRAKYFKESVESGAAIQVISKDVRDRLLSSFSLDPSRVFLTYHPIGLDEFSRYQGGERASIETYFIYPANFWMHKNHRRLLDAFARFVSGEGMEKYHLYFTGHPDAMMEEMKLYANELSLGDHVRFQGYVSLETYKKLLWQAKALVFPSLNEGFGIPILEAMAMGVPVMCSAVTALPEIAGKGALFFDPYQTDGILTALRQMATDEDLGQQMIEKGKENLSRFSFEEDCQNLLRAFRSVIE
ncbi:MAG: glycosyltransferase family 4 protein [Opitutaceae bacterium]|nr:glycosyltransferase family 4 protein [Opitutaceae bacterium]